MTMDSTPGIGGVWMDSPMNWVDEFNWQKMGMEVTQTIDGHSSIQMADLSNTVRPYTLEGGWHKYNKVCSLETLASVVDATYVCSFRNGSKTVMFLWSGGSPIQMQPLVQVASPESTMWYTGSIKMIILPS